MRHDQIINALEVHCPFQEVFEEKEAVDGHDNQYRRKLVHIRADYDGRQWWNTIWPYHNELATQEIRKEIDVVYAALTSPEAFPDLATLTAFCMSHPEAKVNESSCDEFNFYLDGEHCCYWLRCITRDNDYNLYLHAFLKNREVVPDA